MRTPLIIIFILFFTTGCKGKHGVPGGVLSPKKMQVILWDMMRADQFLADFVLNKDSSLNKTTESLKYYQQIFAIHKVSKDEFQHSFSFYKTHPALLKEIMDSINAPEKITLPVTAQPTPLTAPVLPQQDTVAKSPQQTLPDTAIVRKRVKKIAE